jgi:hypothetical protein
MFSPETPSRNASTTAGCDPSKTARKGAYRANPLGARGATVPDELERLSRHDPLAILMGIVLVTEADGTVLAVEQAGIDDSDIFRVVSQIQQDLFGPPERAWHLALTARRT